MGDKIGYKSIRDFAAELKCDPLTLNGALNTNDIRVCTDFGDDDGYIDYNVYEQITESMRKLTDLLLSDSDIRINKKPHVPLSKGSFIYFLFDGETIVYVGQTNQILYRIDQHLSTKKFSEITAVPIDKKIQSIIEILYIYRIQPFYNKASISEDSYIRSIVKLCR